MGVAQMLYSYSLGYMDRLRKNFGHKDFVVDYQNELPYYPCNFISCKSFLLI